MDCLVTDIGCGFVRVKKFVDGRDKPGHDENAVFSVCTATLDP